MPQILFEESFFYQTSTSIAVYASILIPDDLRANLKIIEG